MRRDEHIFPFLEEDIRLTIRVIKMYLATYYQGDAIIYYLTIVWNTYKKN